MVCLRTERWKHSDLVLERLVHGCAVNHHRRDAAPWPRTTRDTCALRCTLCCHTRDAFATARDSIRLDRHRRERDVAGTADSPRCASREHARNLTRVLDVHHHLCLKLDGVRLGTRRPCHVCRELHHDPDDDLRLGTRNTLASGQRHGAHGPTARICLNHEPADKTCQQVIRQIL